MGNVCDKMEDGLWLGDKDGYVSFDGKQPEYVRFQSIVTALTFEEVKLWRIHEKVGARNWFHLPIDDACEVPISEYFHDVIEFIEAARQRGDQVLIHCAAGVSRSATLMIAYLMWKRHWTRKEAVEYVVARRKVVDPNDGFMDQLAAWECALTLSWLGEPETQCITDNNAPVDDKVNNQYNRQDV